jgi:hypothetical protein
MCEKHGERDGMADHERGDMDIEEQKKTFAGFTKLVAYGVVAVVIVLLLLTFRI